MGYGTDQFEGILSWYAENCRSETERMVLQTDIGRIKEVEKLSGEPFPPELMPLYSRYDGGEKNGLGAFLGYSPAGLDELTAALAFAGSLVKPENPRASDSPWARELVERMARLCTENLPLKKRWGFLPAKGYRAECRCSPEGMEELLFYPGPESAEAVPLGLPFLKEKEMGNLIKEFHELERESWNWDLLTLRVHGDGREELQREFRLPPLPLPLRSFPEGAVREKYCHSKWLPVLTDGEGSFIGLDLDPGRKGCRGQVIAFGRKSGGLHRLAGSWEEFLDATLERVQELAEASCGEDAALRELYPEQLSPGEDSQRA